MPLTGSFPNITYWEDITAPVKYVSIEFESECIFMENTNLYFQPMIKIKNYDILII